MCVCDQDVCVCDIVVRACDSVLRDRVAFDKVLCDSFKCDSDRVGEEEQKVRCRSEEQEPHTMGRGALQVRMFLWRLVVWVCIGLLH